MFIQKEMSVDYCRVHKKYIPESGQKRTLPIQWQFLERISPDVLMNAATFAKYAEEPLCSTSTSACTCTIDEFFKSVVSARYVSYDAAIKIAHRNPDPAKISSTSDIAPFLRIIISDPRHCSYFIRHRPKWIKYSYSRIEPECFDQCYIIMRLGELGEEVLAQYEDFHLEPRTYVQKCTEELASGNLVPDNYHWYLWFAMALDRQELSVELLEKYYREEIVCASPNLHPMIIYSIAYYLDVEFLHKVLALMMESGYYTNLFLCQVLAFWATVDASNSLQESCNPLMRSRSCVLLNKRLLAAPIAELDLLEDESETSDPEPDVASNLTAPLYENSLERVYHGRYCHIRNVDKDTDSTFNIAGVEIEQLRQYRDYQFYIFIPNGMGVPDSFLSIIQEYAEIKLDQYISTPKKSARS